MKINNLLIFLLIIPVLNACQKKAAAPPNFEHATKIKTLLNETGDHLSVRIDLDKDFHAYGPKEQIGKPVRLVIQPGNSWAAITEASIPEGRLKKLAGLGESYVLEGSFSVEQKLKPGTGPGKALLYLQICTETFCDRPRTHELVFEMPAKK